MTDSLACDHHWHLDNGDRPGGRRVELEIKTSGNPGWPVICCRCGATSHRTAGEHECFGRAGVGPAIGPTRVTMFQLADLLGPETDPVDGFLDVVDDARIRAMPMMINHGLALTWADAWRWWVVAAGRVGERPAAVVVVSPDDLPTASQAADMLRGSGINVDVRVDERLERRPGAAAYRIELA